MDAIFPKISKTSPYILVAAGVVVLVLVLALLSRKIDTGAGVYSAHYKKTLKNLLSQSTRWSSVASQDQNPMIALMHINYALGFLKACRRLASDSDIQKITGSNIVELSYIMENQQAELMSQISAKCPELGLDGVVALNAGWTG